MQLETKSITDCKSVLILISQKCEWTCSTCEDFTSIIDAVMQAEFIRDISDSNICVKLLEMDSDCK